MFDNVTPIGSAPSLRGEGALPASDDAHYRFALRVLGARAMSSGALRKRLASKDVPPDEIEAILERLQTNGCLDDASFASTRIERLRERGHHGDRAIRQRLMQDGVSSSDIETALADNPGDSEALLLEAAHERAPRLRGLDREVAERRLTAYLQRRGHGGSGLRQAVTEALDALNDE